MLGNEACIDYSLCQARRGSRDTKIMRCVYVLGNEAYENRNRYSIKDFIVRDSQFSNES